MSICIYIYTYICRFFVTQDRYHENAAQIAIIGRDSLLCESSSRFCREFLDVESPTTSTTPTTKIILNDKVSQKQQLVKTEHIKYIYIYTTRCPQSRG
jgi:hypothetical protein